ncbi:GNAT family N-acetyltransferase [Paenarthrobacter ureafaciens]|uniref:GNAT family N-acetyltransferase n=1 Tax=Paenarthrobacter TaxID=1742992 RepID=UPI0015BBCD87|nr:MULTISPECIES: GNAT family N-acetyltransferase [Paenarthrobacter]NWL27911.1 GNAT family N-acetyltransferase [Paenarthrobacter ureafaciens]QOT16205.1 GNAT family N-acetyltransferase [Paenarthrobacter sp. YJN-5]UOD80252.1 GNAT family N-acetyltransferase [Paenarthrobacter ureafaciens]WNZ04399.1 GNAT family N-acetyltransferase [Paenarthrobacter ureafaciens]
MAETVGMTLEEAKTVEVEQAWVPDNLDSPDAKDFLDAVEVARRVRMQTWGSDDLAYTPLEKMLEFSDPYERQIILVAKVDGKIVGTIDIALPLADNIDLAEFTLDVLPEYQRRGVGRHLLEAAEQLARAEGRTMVLVDTNHPATSLTEIPEDQLIPGTGPGFVPVSSREVDFAQRAGYTLQHIEQFSSCVLPLDSKLVADLQAEAEEANAGRYALHHWTDRCPERLLEGVAELENAAGEVVHGEDEDDEPAGADTGMVFDAAVLRETEDAAMAQGRRTVVTAVEHVATGKLVGLTTISVLAHRQDVVFQDDTLVLQEHRGNKLGLLIKVANMERLSEQFPDARVIYTWNAPENRYLLTVNKQLGFTTAGVTGLWQKELPRRSAGATTSD